MIAARGPGYVGLAIAGVALAIGLVAGGGKDDGADRDKREAFARARAVAIDLPAGAAADEDDADDDDDDTVTVEVRRDGVLVDGAWHADGDLTDLIRGRDDAELTAVVRSSSDLPYARVVEVLELLRGAGVTKIAMQADPDATP